jgi:hypothetical protein
LDRHDRIEIEKRLPGDANECKDRMSLQALYPRVGLSRLGWMDHVQANTVVEALRRFAFFSFLRAVKSNLSKIGEVAGVDKVWSKNHGRKAFCKRNYPDL